MLLIPRYMLVTGLTVLALAFFSDQLTAMGDEVDFELILPFAMREFMPVGLLGMLIAGLLAAFMSTYAATVNAAPAYVVNDIYKRYIRPDASDRTTSDELCRVDHRRSDWHCDRDVVRVAQSHCPMDCHGSVWRIHGGEPVEVDLVAIQ